MSVGEASQVFNKANEAVLQARQKQSQIVSTLLQSTAKGQRIGSASRSASNAEHEALLALTNYKGSDKAVGKNLLNDYLRRSKDAKRASKDELDYLKGFPSFKAAEEQVKSATQAYESASNDMALAMKGLF
jgi:hypothetical protein